MQTSNTITNTTTITNYSFCIARNGEWTQWAYTIWFLYFTFFFISFTFSIMFVAKRRNRADRPVLVMALCYVI